MKNFHNFKYIYSYSIFFIFLLYLFLHTGIHGDDYALIQELQYKVKLFDISAENLSKYIYNIPSYFIWCLYAFIGYENLLLYDLLKYLLNLVSIIFFYLFFKDYFSNIRSIVISFIIVMYPIHDSSNYWLMATPLYIFFPSMIFFAYTLINKNFYILGSFVLLLASFNYTSPPFVLGLSVIFLLEKKFNKFLLFLLIGSIYVFFYYLISNFYPNLEHRVDDNLSFYMILINFILQFITSLDVNVGLSFFVKIFYSISSIDIKIIIIIPILIHSFHIVFKKKIFELNNDSNKTKLNILISMTLIYFSSLGIFALTSSYPQTAFNLGNRITIYSTFLIVVLFSMLIKRNFIFLILSLVLILSIIGVSNHWKELNKKNINIINNINTNEKFSDLDKNDILLVKDNLYSKLGKISHIEFLIIPWVSNKIFTKYANFTVLPLSKYLYLNENFISNNKEGTKHIIKGNIYLYDTSKDLITMIDKKNLDTIIENEESIFRHWIQLNEFQILSKVIIKIYPRLNYLFI